MSHKAIKIGVTAFVLIAAFSALMFTTLQDNLQYYKFVDEVAEAPHEWQGKTLKIHGNVKPKSLEINGSLDYRFALERNGKVVTAYYSGALVDGFKDEAEVILTGRFTENGFTATDMEAKCPSKYEEAPPPGPAATPTS